MCGYVESSRDSRECREDVDDEYWAVEGHDDSCYPGSNTANRGHHDQDSFPASPDPPAAPRRAPPPQTAPCAAVPPAQPRSRPRPGRRRFQVPRSKPTQQSRLRRSSAEHGANCRSPHCSRTPMRPPSTCCAAVGSSPATITLGTVTPLCVRALRGKAYAARSHQDQEGELIFSRVLSDHRRIKINFCNALGSRVEGSRPVAGSRFWAQKSS